MTQFLYGKHFDQTSDLSDEFLSDNEFRINSDITNLDLIKLLFVTIRATSNDTSLLIKLKSLNLHQDIILLLIYSPLSSSYNGGVKAMFDITKC